MFSKKIFVPIFAVLVMGIAIFGFNTIASAQTGNTPFSGLAQALASQFKLNQSDVQNAINAYMQKQRGNRVQNAGQMQKKRLDQLVSQGKITSGQEAAILAELTTLQSQYGPSSFKNMTQAQRKQAMQNEKAVITAWAKSNGINPIYVMPFGMGQRGGNWHRPTLTPTP